MDILGYIQSLLSKRNYYVEPIKLTARDKTDTQTVTKPINPDITFTPNEEGLINAFPKQMNWLNWENKGFKNALLDSQIWTESRGNPNAVGPMTRYGVSAVGAGQFMPKTWEGAIRRGWISKDAKRTDLQASLIAQEKYMDLLYNSPAVKNSKTEKEKYVKTLVAYNYGPGNLQKALKKVETQGGDLLDHVPSETQNYVKQIMEKTEEDYFKNKEDYVSKYQRN